MHESELPDLTILTSNQKDDLIRQLFEQVRVLTARVSTLNHGSIQGDHETERLVDFLSRNATSIDPDLLNRIRCQVLELYYALRSGQNLNVETDQQLWLYSPASQQIIFPCSASAYAGKNEASALYTAWADFLVSLKLWLVKPAKEKLAVAEQAALQHKVADALMSEIAAVAAVDRIYLMGSALRGDMGRYLAPFVNGHEAKLGSDVVILVEINPAREADIPEHWNLIKQDESSSRCSIYHARQIPVAGGVDEWVERYPHLPLIQHLVEVYVFFPSRGHHVEKDAFLNKYGAKLFYDRTRDGVVNRTGEEARIAGRIAELYGFTQVVVEKMDVITLNALYKVYAGEHDYVLKLFKVSGTYIRERIAEHAVYEEKLIVQLKERGILTAGVIPVIQGEGATIEGYPALLFERIRGVSHMKPEYPLDKVCAALAKIHQIQMDNPLDLVKDFSYEGIYSIWRPLFQYNLNFAAHSPEIAEALAKFVPLFKRCDSAKFRNALYASGPSVHNHGDVTPKNVITGEQGEIIFFDFNNAFYGPRLADVLDGAFEYSLAEQYIRLADFARFDAFISQYSAVSPLTDQEIKKLPQWIVFAGLIKFTREVNALRTNPEDELRRKRVLAIAEFVLSRKGS